MTKVTPFENLRIAIIHFWYTRLGGAERVLETLADLFPQADIFIMFMDPSVIPPSLRKHRITTSFLQKIPRITRHYRKLLPLFPLAQEQFQLDDYDLVISSEAGPAKGVLTRPSTCHICYCHTPMRYVWDMSHHYRSTSPFGRLGRAVYSLSAHYMRMWDYSASARVDYFVASSLNGAARIRKYYRREVDVIYPPVDTSSFSISSDPQDFYLVVSRLVSYKRVDLAVAACSKLKRRLVVIGQGEQLPLLQRIAGPTVTFLGFQSDEVVRQYYRSCRALLFPGEEDIGLTPIEVQASGRPVIAYGRGGALETVIGFEPANVLSPDESTGLFFQEQSVDAVVNAIECFEAIESEFLPEFIRAQAQRFDVTEFKKQFTSCIAEKFAPCGMSKRLPLCPSVGA
jgi:glycosyltransferase involved in cell wall biosynthesis